MDNLEILNSSVDKVAKRLLGCEFVREIDGKTIRVKIVETEAYDQTDAASHAYNGRTPRADVMFGPAGHLYVYFTYGMHYCCNVVAGKEGYGAGVLIRAVEPIEGELTLEKRRGGKVGTNLTNGPAKLCQALGIDKRMNGHDLKKSPLKLIVRPATVTDQIVATTRVGISKAMDVKWRFYLVDNSYVSVK